jgi:hypothetical protein
MDEPTERACGRGGGLEIPPGHDRGVHEIRRDRLLERHIAAPAGTFEDPVPAPLSSRNALVLDPESASTLAG